MFNNDHRERYTDETLRWVRVRTPTPTSRTIKPVRDRRACLQGTTCPSDMAVNEGDGLRCVHCKRRVMGIWDKKKDERNWQTLQP